MKFGLLDLVLSPNTISCAKDIPRLGEMWFEEQKIKLQNYDEFLKEECKGIDMTTGIPRTCLKEHFSKILMII